MRLIAVSALALVSLACAPAAVSPVSPAVSAAPSAQPDVQGAQAPVIDPGRIDRARARLPDGYEVSAFTGSPTPVAAWGFGDSAVSDPAPCGVLAAPAVDAASAKGWSASGDGGIVYAVVATADPLAAPHSDLSAACANWTLSSGPSTATVTAAAGPHIDDAATVAMSTASTTAVEGSTVTRSRADTAVAYLGDHVCFVAVVTDPGAPQPGLAGGFAADLLAETVSTLRG